MQQSSAGSPRLDRAARAHGFAWFLPLLVACSGSIGVSLEASPGATDGPRPGGAAVGTGAGAGGAPGTVASCLSGAAESRPLQHLTRAFYDATVRDLLGDETHPAAAFPLDDMQSGFAVGRSVSPRLARDWVEAAEAIAARAVAGDNLGRLLPCRVRDDACALAFLDDFLPRAFRRPPRAAEREDFVALYREAAAAHDVATGVQLVIQTALQSPQFLYLAEPPPAPAGAPVPPEVDFAIAARLSYFLAGTMPDRELFAAARAGALHTRAQVAAQAERLMASPGYAESARDLASQWFRLSDLEHLEKPGGALTPSMVAALHDSAFAFAHHALVARDSLDVLLTDATVFVDRDLAPLYGLSSASPTLVPVAADPAERAGILTHAGLLARLGKALQPDPIHRGVFVRRALLCEVLAPPPEVPPLPEGDDLAAQVRAHADNPQCSGCHRLIDPVGFGFQRYDGLGRYRAEDARGQPIQVAGVLEEVDDASWPFASVRELTEILRARGAVQDCAVRRVFRHALRRAERDADACAIDEAARAFRAAGGSFRTLALALVASDGFRLQAGSGATGGGQ